MGTPLWKGESGYDESVIYPDYFAPIVATRVVGIVARKWIIPKNEKPVKLTGFSIPTGER